MEMQKRRMCIVKGSTDSYEDNYKQNKGSIWRCIIRDSINGNSRDGSWYDDYSIFPISPFFIRGGSYNNGTNAGMFAFYADNGNIDSFNSFTSGLGRTLIN